MSKTTAQQTIKVIDLFCGIGGMTHGFQSAGFNVVAGIDNDISCKYGYEHNNKSEFIHKNIEQVTSREILDLYGDCSIRVLIGCAPCQPYSGLNPYKGIGRNMSPLEKFANLIEEVKPEIVSMENVKGLAQEYDGKSKFPEFKKFLETLRKNDYEVAYKIVDTSDYGIPQRRFRMVLLASRLGKISLIKATNMGSKKVTLRKVISDLEPLKDGEINRSDPLHRASKLSELNKKRIKATPKNGGSSKDWDESLKLKCHLKASGKTFSGTVYGRMRWDQPAPTMTTQCIGLGNGRFGHPEQDRAISLREAARIQTFPDNYEFLPSDKIKSGVVARFIGNAVPVKLGAVIAKSIKEHLNQFSNFSTGE